MRSSVPSMASSARARSRSVRIVSSRPDPSSFTDASLPVDSSSRVYRADPSLGEVAAATDAAARVRRVVVLLPPAPIAVLPPRPRLPLRASPQREHRDVDGEHVRGELRDGRPAFDLPPPARVADEADLRRPVELLGEVAANELRELRGDVEPVGEGGHGSERRVGVRFPAGAILCLDAISPARRSALSSLRLPRNFPSFRYLRVMPVLLSSFRSLVPVTELGSSARMLYAAIARRIASASASYRARPSA